MQALGWWSPDDLASAQGLWNSFDRQYLSAAQHGKVYIEVLMSDKNHVYLNRWQQKPLTKPVNIDQKKCRLPFPCIGFSPVLLPFPLTFPTTTVLICWTAFFIARIIKCRLGGWGFLGNISNKSFIWVPWYPLKPMTSKNIHISGCLRMEVNSDTYKQKKYY